jgi:GNAT superfamily N-acetyltransferase
MELAINELMTPWLNAAEIAASYEHMGLDTQLIDDQSYFAVEVNGQFAGCGGWSWRSTLFGGNHTGGRDATLDPARDSARIRAMYTHPAFVRRGIGQQILYASEAAALASGFASAQLMATMAGVPFYTACGYWAEEGVRLATSVGIFLPFTRMTKALAAR